MGGSLGFAVLRMPSGKRVGKAPYGEIVRTKKEFFPIYRITEIPPLSETDIFRIEKVLKIYEEKADFQSLGDERKKDLQNLVSKYSSALGIKGKKLSDREKKVYAEVCYIMSGEGLGPLSLLLPDDELEEIMVNGLNKPIYVYHRKFGMCKTNLTFDRPDYFVEKVNQILSSIGRRIDETHPRAHGVLKSGDRIAALMPPYSRDYSLDIRKFSVRPLTVLDLIKKNMLTYEAAAFLWIIFEAGCNVGIVGNTGAGKTTLLNALFRFVPYHQRVLCVEETPEIQIPQEQYVRMISVENLDITLQDAILDSLRLRPGRVIIGEVRSPQEVEALKDSCLAGQALGTYFTYHAENSNFAIQRLNEQGFSPRDLTAINLLVVCKRYEKKSDCRTHRTVTEIVEITKKFNALPKLKTLFSYDFAKDLLKKKTLDAELVKSISKLYFSGKISTFMKELKRRERILKSLKPLSDKDFFTKIQGG